MKGEEGGKELRRKKIEKILKRMKFKRKKSSIVIGNKMIGWRNLRKISERLLRKLDWRGGEEKKKSLVIGKEEKRK